MKKEMETSQFNNARALRRQICGLLGKSEMWIVIRNDSEGTHLHTPNEDHLVLLAMLFDGNPELFEMVSEFMESINEKNK